MIGSEGGDGHHPRVGVPDLDFKPVTTNSHRDEQLHLELFVAILQAEKKMLQH